MGRNDMSRIVLVLSAAVTTLLVSGACHAEAEPDSGGPFASVAALKAEQLSKVAGGADLAQQILAQNMSAVSGNSVTGDSVTGTIEFSSSAFQGINGLSIVSANTGNNVSINSSLNVNISVHQ